METAGRKPARGSRGSDASHTHHTRGQAAPNSLCHTPWPTRNTCVVIQTPRRAIPLLPPANRSRSFPHPDGPACVTLPIRPPATAPVAQLDRASDYGSGGWEFESSRARHLAHDCTSDRRPLSRRGHFRPPTAGTVTRRATESAPFQTNFRVLTPCSRHGPVGLPPYCSGTDVGVPCGITMTLTSPSSTARTRASAISCRLVGHGAQQAGDLLRGRRAGQARAMRLARQIGSVWLERWLGSTKSDSSIGPSIGRQSVRYLRSRPIKCREHKSR